MAQILVGATIVGSIETVWAGTITPPREGIIKRWTWPAGENDGSVAPLKGQEMGRFKLGSTVINLFAPGKVDLVEQLESIRLSRKLASRWQYLPKPLLRQMLNQPRFLLKRSKRTRRQPIG